MSTRLIKSLLITAGLLTLSACSDSDRESAPQQQTQTDTGTETEIRVKDLSVPPDRIPKVVESFQVGHEVFVRSLAIDTSSNSLWVGTSTGVLEIDLNTSNPINTFTRADGLANEYVFAIFVDSQGYKWFGTNAGGASRYRDGKWDVYFPMHGLADYWVYSFVEQKNGPLWIGTWAGANSVDLSTMEFKTYLTELINEWVYALDIDSVSYTHLTLPTTSP